MCIVFSFAFIPNCGHHHRESVFSSLQQSRCSFFFFFPSTHKQICKFELKRIATFCYFAAIHYISIVPQVSGDSTLTYVLCRHGPHWRMVKTNPIEDFRGSAFKKEFHRMLERKAYWHVTSRFVLYLMPDNWPVLNNNPFPGWHVIYFVKDYCLALYSTWRVACC